MKRILNKFNWKSLVVLFTIMSVILILSFSATAPEEGEEYVDYDWQNQDLKDVNWNEIQWEQVNWNRMETDDLSAILNENPNVMADSTFLRRFETKAKDFSAADFEKMGTEGQNAWLFEKSNGALSLQEGANVKSFSGSKVVTAGLEGVEFDPERLPPGQEFIVLPRGALQRVGVGTFSGGSLSYNEAQGTLTTDSEFVDVNDNSYICGSVCFMDIRDDGSVESITGEGIINDIGVADLDNIYFEGEIMHATTKHEGSFIEETRLFSNNEITYDPSEKIIEGKHIEVYETDRKTKFKGKNIRFFDEEERLVATLDSGETKFITGNCRARDEACVSAKGEKISVKAKDSKITIDAEGYKEVYVSEIKDGSLVTLMKGKDTVSTFNKSGMHPRMDLKESGLKIKYGHELNDGISVIQESGELGDKSCKEGEECQSVNSECRVG